MTHERIDCAYAGAELEMQVAELTRESMFHNLSIAHKALTTLTNTRIWNWGAGGYRLQATHVE